MAVAGGFKRPAKTADDATNVRLLETHFAGRAAGLGRYRNGCSGWISAGPLLSVNALKQTLRPRRFPASWAVLSRPATPARMRLRGQTRCRITWRLHWLEASGDLGPWRGAVAKEVEIARKAVARVLPVSPLDILVQRLPGAVIPETGTTGQAMRPGLFSLTIDPDNPNFARAA